MQIDDLRPTPSTRNAMLEMTFQAEAVHAMALDELESHGITQDTKMRDHASFIVYASAALHEKYNALILRLISLPVDNLRFLENGTRGAVSENRVEDAKSGNTYLFLQSVPKDATLIKQGLAIMQTEDDDVHVCRHFYIAAQQFLRKATTLALRTDTEAMDRTAEEMGLVAIAATPEDSIAFSDSKKRLNQLFDLLSDTAKAEMNARLKDTQGADIESAMRKANGNDLKEAAQISARIVKAATARWPDFYQGSSARFDVTS